MTKKLISIIMLFAMVLGFASCGVKDEYQCPRLYFTGDMSEMKEKKDVRNITFEYHDMFNGEKRKITGAAEIKIQGNSSLKFAKKNYTIKFFENEDFEEKLEIDVGWGEECKYCLKANWIDKTHCRNIVSAKLASEVQAKYNLFETAPKNGLIDGFPIEIYINGEFHGLYTMNIPKDEWMFNMDSDNPDHIVVCGENWTDPVLFKAEPNLTDWSVEVGPEDEETLAKLTRLSDFIRNSTDEEFKANFNQYLDLDSTLNYYILADCGYMADNLGKNMLLATYDGVIWYPTLYDMDSTWGAHWSGTQLYTYEENLLYMSKSLLFERVQKLFSKELADRYFELRQDILSSEHIMDTFNSFYNSIPEDLIARETEKWGTEIPGYDLSQIQGYVDSVMPRLDEKYGRWR